VSRPAPDDVTHARKALPAAYAPGTPEALEVLAGRVQRGEELFAAHDRPGHGGPARAFSGTFGASLRRLRRERGLSLGQLALAAGVLRTALHEFERGRALPRFGTLLGLADALGVGLDELAGRTGRETTGAGAPAKAPRPLIRFDGD
jgi:DNA-binding XRE family transcriptional regulator